MEANPLARRMYEQLDDYTMTAAGIAPPAHARTYPGPPTRRHHRSNDDAFPAAAAARRGPGPRPILPAPTREERERMAAAAAAAASARAHAAAGAGPSIGPTIHPSNPNANPVQIHREGASRRRLPARDHRRTPHGLAHGRRPRRRRRLAAVRATARAQRRARAGEAGRVHRRRSAWRGGIDAGSPAVGAAREVWELWAAREQLWE